MALTNSPGGLASFGFPVLPGSVYDAFSGPAYFVCNGKTPNTRGQGDSAGTPYPSIADALARIATDGSAGARVFVLEGHAENVTASNTFSGTDANGPNTGAQTIPAGCRIIGLGVDRTRPTLTFTAAGSTIALANANTTIENFNLLCPQTGTTTTAAMVTVTAQGCGVHACQFQMAASATALATTGISLSSAASEFESNDCTGYSVTGTPVSWLSTTGTTGASRVKIRRANVLLSLSATTGGVVDVSSASGTAPTLWEMRECGFGNLTTNSTVAVKGVAGWTGHMLLCGLIITNATGAATSISAGSLSVNQTTCTQPGKAGINAGSAAG